MIHGKIKSKGESFKYSINITEDELINGEVKDRVLAWCKEFHPKVFAIARKKVLEDLQIKPQIKPEKKLNTNC